MQTPKRSIFNTKAIIVKRLKYFNAGNIVKLPGKITFTIAVFIIIVGAVRFQPSPAFSSQVDEYFGQQLESVKKELSILKKLNEEKAAATTLRQQFITCRKFYKQLAVLSEYFNIYETKFLNGPALPRAEDGTPDVIIPPQGFQALEELIFGNDQLPEYAMIDELIEKMLSVLQQIEKEPDRQYKFRPEMVWDALRSSVVRLATLGITGFDSPVALNSFDEARATIEGIRKVLALFKRDLDKDPRAWKQLNDLLTSMERRLAAAGDFNRFDRLDFITTYINPIYRELVITRKSSGIGIPEGRSPVNFDAESIFDKNFFDINFFSPGKEYRPTVKRIELGRKLFADPVLSGSGNRSCASCHIPEKAFTDGLKVPTAIDDKTLLRRNTPTLWNSALQTRQFFDTRTDILENQLKEVVHNTEEMEGSLHAATAVLKKSPEYLLLFKQAYADEMEPLNAYNIANAISSYIRTLISLNSRFDQYMSGDKTKLNSREKKGFNLFTGKAKCATCHFIPLFNGLVPPEFTETETEVLGTPSTKNKKNAKLDTDAGKFELTQSVIHKFAFKTPGLRNIEKTGPYMHNGVFDTLEEVMDFYNEGGGAGLNIAPENQTLPTDKLDLSKKEIESIIAFMKSLTDPAITTYK